jgi:hypothetical protein
MKRLRTKLVLLAVVGMLALSITIVSAQGWWKTVYLRPIDDWMANNPWGASPGWGGYDYEDDWYIMYVAGWVQGEFYDYNSYGFVLEEVMPDGSLKYTVYLSGRNIYIEVYNSNPPPDLGIQDIVVIGTMDFFFRIQFILDPTYPGGDTPWGYIDPGVRAPGCELPWFFLMAFTPDVIGGRIIFGNFKGSGSGDLMVPGSIWDFDLGMFDPPAVPTGATANVFIHQQWHIDYYGNEIWTNEWLVVS